jgi:hypothetical protein
MGDSPTYGKKNCTELLAIDLVIDKMTCDLT